MRNFSTSSIQLGNRSGGVFSFCPNVQFAPRPGREHHQAHDAFAIDPLAVLFHKNVALKAVGRLDKHRCGPGVNAEFVPNHQLAGDGGVFVGRLLRRAHSAPDYEDEQAICQ